MLLEELLGISNKRLKYIFSGQNIDGESSSCTESEEEKPIDIISLDDITSISDDDTAFGVANQSKSTGKFNYFRFIIELSVLELV